ncbi:MAG: lecithin retinol acyltransferase family protein [Gammaproteobacteria bacterium]
MQAISARELPLGAHVITPRRGYLHHGIYVGDGKVVHYAGLANGLRRGPVEEVPLGRFASGRPFWLRPSPAPAFDAAEIVCRARSRVGERRYRLFTNNCEHFCEWSVRGEPRSLQVEAWLRRPARMVLTTMLLICAAMAPWSPSSTADHEVAVAHNQD